MLNKCAYLLVLAVPALAFAGDDPKAAKGGAAPPPAAAPPPPEVKKTVDAFVGRTVFDATLEAPGMPKPAAFKATFDCKKAALGKAVDCSMRAKTPMGPFEGEFLIAYDQFSKTVHFIGVTSEDEVHTHVCHWSDDKTLTCDPLKAGTTGGAPITEDVKIAWGDGKVSFESVSAMADGSKVTFKGTAKRK